MDFLALDIGGANLKAADGRGFAVAEVFDLRENPAGLTQELRTLIAGAPFSDHLLVTMTGELSKCFTTREEGVRFIIDAVAGAADGRHTRIYLTDGMMVIPQVALKRPVMAAGSNWHVLAKYASRFARQGPGLSIDIGSTTCDVVPLLDGEIAAAGKTDVERLIRNELIYTGVERSPLCALATSAPFRDGFCPLVQETFATTRDVYLILGSLSENPGSTATADGRPATKGAARARLGRMICADQEEFNHRDAVAMAQALAEAQLLKIVEGVTQVIQELPSAPETVVVSGEGEFLARKVVERMNLEADVVSLAKELGPSLSVCAPAHALAVLAREAAGLA